VHIIGVIEAREGQNLFHTIPSFSVTPFEKGFGTTSYVIPEEGLCSDTEEKDGVAEEELGGPGRKERKG
jgi:hypothetical protein